MHVRENTDLPKARHCLSQESIRPRRQTASFYAGKISHYIYRTGSCFDQRSKSHCQWPVNV